MKKLIGLLALAVLIVSVSVAEARHRHRVRHHKAAVKVLTPVVCNCGVPGGPPCTCPQCDCGHCEGLAPEPFAKRDCQTGLVIQK